MKIELSAFVLRVLKVLTEIGFEPEYVDKPSAEKEVDIFKDVSWLDDDVEMVIEYPHGDSVPPAPPPQAPTEGPAAKRENGEAATTTRTTMSGTNVSENTILLKNRTSTTPIFL